MNPCDTCIRVNQAEVRGWLAGLNHKQFCTEDETCPCWIVVEQGPRKVPTRAPEEEDRPLIDLVEKK